MNKKAKIAVSLIVSLVISVISFFIGFYTCRLTEDRATASYEWAMKIIEENYYFDEPDGGYTQTALSVIAEKYLDRYSAYYTKEQYAEVMKSNSGSKSGIGISYAFVEGRGIFISSVVGNSPAYNCGLREGKKGLCAGEFLVSGSVGGGEAVAFDIAQSFAGFVSKAADGESILFTAEDGTQYTVAKAEYNASYTSLSTCRTGWNFRDSADGGLALYEDTAYAVPYLPEGCAYLRLDQFFGNAASEFYSLVEKFNALGCTSLILDLRSNGGGYVSVMQEIAGSFADGKSQLAMLSREKDGDEAKFLCERVWNENQRISKDVDVFVLANSGTASASEALIGAMVCYGALDYKDIFLSDYSQSYIDWLQSTGQEVKTARTYGKGIMQTPFTNYRTGEVLKLTTAKIFWPDETTSIHDVGVTVSGNGCTPVPAEWEWSKGDPELAAAVSMISERL